MEDLKKIQEFFSKPLEEGKQLDIVDFAKVVQAVTKTGHPVTVLLTPKFNEIEIITGMNAPDDMLRDLSIAVDSLGYDIIIAADSSNLSRREYSDIRRVNGGHKDYFEESLEEDASIELRPVGRDTGVKLNIRAIKKHLEGKGYTVRYQNGSSMLNPQGIDVFNPELGSTLTITRNGELFGDGNWGVEVSSEKEAIQALSQYEREMNENVKAEFTDYSNKELAAYLKTNPTDKTAAKELHKRSQALKGLTRTDVKEQADHVAPMVVKAYKEYLEAKKEGNGEKAYRYYSKKLNNTYSTRADRDAIEAILKKKYGSALEEATKEEETEFHTKLDKLVHDTFGKRKGEMEENMSLDDQAKAYFLAKVKKGEIDTLPDNPKAAFLAQKLKSGELDEYNTGIYYNPARDKSVDKSKEASKVGLEKVRDMIKKIMKEDLADYEEKDADYDKLYSDYLYKMVKEVATEKGYSKFLVSKDNPKGETSGLDTKTMNKILMNVIKDLDETIQLGKNLEEGKLCPKGEAYRKRRMAAGEKSSAYLSGRAVKVCKGQMSGKKKK